MSAVLGYAGETADPSLRRAVSLARLCVILV